MLDYSRPVQSVQSLRRDAASFKFEKDQAIVVETADI